MSKYESQVKQIPSPIEAVYAKLSNLENLRPIVENAQNNEQLKREVINLEAQEQNAIQRFVDLVLQAGLVVGGVPAAQLSQGLHLLVGVL